MPSARWRGAAFTRTLFARTFLKPRVYQVGGREQAAAANVSSRCYNPQRFTSFLPAQHDKAKPQHGTFAGAACGQRLRNTMVVCTITSGYGQPPKAAPLQPPTGSAAGEATLHI